MTIYSFLLNWTIGILIFGWAIYQLTKLFRNSKKGKCGGCDSSCEAKALMEAAKKRNG